MKKFLAILLTICFIVVSLVGCGTKQETSISATTVATTNETTATQELAADPYGKYEEPVTINLVNFTTDSLNQELETVGETFEINRWTKLFKDKLNIDLKYKWIAANSDQYNAKFNIMMASGDLPDIFNIDATQSQRFKQLLDADKLADLTEVYNKYIGPEYSSVTLKDPYMLSSGTFGGKLMGLAHGATVPYSSVNVLWLRYDWLEKLGLSEPKNLDDVINIAKAFKEASPDGVTVTSGLGFAKELDNNAGQGNNFTGFLNAFHAYRNIWIEKNGKLEYGAIQPEMKVALQKLSELYNDGTIDMEFAVKDHQKIEEEMLSGKIGMAYMQMWYPLVLNGFMDIHPEGDLRAYPLVSADDQPALGETNAMVQSWNVVRKGFEHPEALIKMCNVANLVQNGAEALQISPDGNTTNVIYYTAPEGAPTMYNVTNLWYNLLPDVNVYRYVLADAVIKKDPTGVETADMFIYDNMLKYLEGDNAQWGWYQSFCKDVSGSAAINYAFEHKLGYVDKFNGLPSEKMTQKMTLIDTKLTEEFTKIIMGESSIDDFDNTVVDSFNKLGGDDVTKEVNEWYEVNK